MSVKPRTTTYDTKLGCGLQKRRVLNVQFLEEDINRIARVADRETIEIRKKLTHKSHWENRRTRVSKADIIRLAVHKWLKEYEAKQ